MGRIAGAAKSGDALEMVATLLEGEEPIYAESSILAVGSDAPGETATFVMVAFTSDRIAHVTGSLDGEWPTGTVVPRSEVRRLELLRTPLKNYEPLYSDSAAVALHFDGLDIVLPLNASTGAATALADHLPTLLRDRAGRIAG